MKNKAGFFSIITAGVLAFGFAAQTALPALRACASTAQPQYTFDKEHFLTEKVYPGGFNTNNTAETKEELVQAIEFACSMSRTDITYGDLLNIYYLDLSGLGLTELPPCIQYMENLQGLDLSYNLLQSDSISQLDFSALKALDYLDLSSNYLSKVPSLYVLDSITSKYIDDNFINIENQRSINAKTPVYYFMSGDALNANAFKNRVLADICLDDGSALPDFLYDPGIPSYDASDASKKDPDPKYPLHIEECDIESFIDADGKVKDITDKYDSTTVKIRLFDNENNANTNVEIKIYFLDGSDPSTVKARLESLLEETKALDKDKYTAKSWSNLESASKSSEAIFNYPAADTTMLKNALEQLDGAKNTLILGVDKDTKKALTDLSSAGKTYKQEDYTPVSWKTFQSALDDITAIAADANATLVSAQAAIIDFQTAQSGLTNTRLVIPSDIAKSDFESIYGTGDSVSASGITHNGREYRWKFIGTGINAPANFNAQITDSVDNEEKILLESGKAGSYLAFSTSQTGDFPGVAALTMNVSDVFDDGKYYLYEWSSEGKLASEVTVKNGSASITLEKGGTFYISQVLQKFDLTSSKVEADSAKHTVTVPLCKGYTVSSFKNLFKYGSSTAVTDADGNAASGAARVKSGMIITPPGGKPYEITVMGDVNEDGYVNTTDAMLILKNISLALSKKPAAETPAEGSAETGGTGTLGVNGNPEAATGGSSGTQAAVQNFGISVTGVNVADVNGDGKANTKDAVLILKTIAQ